MTNPLGFCYGSAANVELYEGASAMLVTGEGNRHNPAFKAARARGVELLTYLDLSARPNATTNPIWLGIYMNDLSKVPLWGKDENGEWRSNWPGKLLADIRPGSAWANYAVDYVANLMRSDEFDGVFLDVLGCRQWGSRVRWETWPLAEQQAWTAGNVDLVRRIHLKRMEINPDFLLINNNIWIDPANGIDASEAERYVDGICLEGHEATVVKNGLTISSWHWNHAKRRFARLGQRRMLIISNSDADALVWATHPDVTHVASVFKDSDPATPDENYQRATPPVLQPTDIRIPELRAKLERARLQLAEAQSGGDMDAQLRAELADLRTHLEQVRTERNDARAEIEELEQQIEMLQQRALSATNSLDTSVAALRSAIEQLSGGSPE